MPFKQARKAFPKLCNLRRLTSGNDKLTFVGTSRPPTDWISGVSIQRLTSSSSVQVGSLLLSLFCFYWSASALTVDAPLGISVTFLCRMRRSAKGFLLLFPAVFLFWIPLFNLFEVPVGSWCLLRMPLYIPINSTILKVRLDFFVALN